MSTDPPTYAPEREVRFAIVMYGGVSLAIYINGVAQELLRMVRATAPQANADELAFSDKDLGNGSDAVYREVARRLNADGTLQPGPGDISTRFVVDILAGTSAGGINGIFLAKALANGEDIDLLREMWVDEGDIARLFNEEENYEDLPSGVSFVEPPTALLIGQRLYAKAHAALQAMSAPADRSPRPRFAEQVDLAVTTTDLQGLPLPIQLADRAVAERRHRTVLRFVYATEAATGDHRNDFTGHDDLLAFAARATSSFPFAFEPVVITDLDQTTPGAAARITEEGDRFFGDYTRAKAKYHRYAFADGGYLDNKPFSGATSALRRRRADVPVARKLLYVEPDPGAPLGADDLEPQERPHAVGNVVKALRLPSVEAIRDDVEAVRERNAAVQRIRKVTRNVEVAALEPGGQLEAPAGLRLAYLRLRRLEILDDLSALIARVLGIAPDGDDARAVRLLLDAWAAEDGEELAEFVDHHDLRYRLRQIEMMHERINVLLTGGRQADHLLAAAGSELTASASASGPGAQWLRDRKTGLNEIYNELRRRGRVARSRLPGDVPDDPDDAALVTAIRDAALGLRLSDEDRDFIVDADDAQKAAGESLGEREAALDEFADALSAYFRPAFERAATGVQAQLAAPGPSPASDLSHVLVQTWNCSRAIDMAVLPLTYPDLGEVNAVEIFRVSPDDATSIQPGRIDGKSRLAGSQVGHFGGFLRQEWRRTDLLWGRLDGAERILAALVPNKDERAPLVEAAQAAILREEIDGDPSGAIEALLTPAGRSRLADARQSDHELVDLFRTEYAPPGPLDRDQAVDLGSRGAAVASDVLGGVARRHGVPAKPLFGLARAARLFRKLRERF